MMELPFDSALRASLRAPRASEASRGVEWWNYGMVMRDANWKHLSPNSGLSTVFVLPTAFSRLPRAYCFLTPHSAAHFLICSDTHPKYFSNLPRNPTYAVCHSAGFPG